MGLFTRRRKSGGVTRVTFSDDGLERSYRVNDSGMSDFIRGNVVLQAILRYRAHAVGALPFQIFDREKNGERFRGIDSLFNSSHLTSVELFSGIVRGLDFDGVAYVLLSDDVTSPTGFRLDIVQDVDYEASSVAGVTVPRERLIRFSFDAPGFECSPLESVKHILSEQYHAWKFSEQVWENAGRVSNIIERPLNAPTWDDEARRNFSRSLRDFRNTRAGETLILEEGMKPAQGRFSTKEDGWSEIQEHGARLLCGAYNMPYEVITGDGKHLNRELRTYLYTETLQPVLRLICETIETRVFPVVSAGRRLKAVFNINAKLSGDFEAQVTALVKATGTPVMLVDEAREKLNLSADVAGGDVLVTPLNVIKGGQTSHVSGEEILPAYQMIKDSEKGNMDV